MSDLKRLIDHAQNNLQDVKEEYLELQKNRLDNLVEQIISSATIIKHEYDYESIRIRYNNGFEPELSRREWFIEYYNEKFSLIGNNLLNKWKKDIGLPFHSHTFEEFLDHKERINRKKIENHVNKLTYQHLKGYFLEWFIFTMFLHHFNLKQINKTSNLVFGVDEPLLLEINGDKTYIWFQKLIKGRSGLDCQPDFTISWTNQLPLNYDNILGIIECKNVYGIQSDHVRKLFAVGSDLMAKFAILISFHVVNKTIKSGAKNIGINIQEIENVVDNPNVIKSKLNNFMQEELFINSTYRTILEKMT